jgi:magnesium transporter
VILAVHFNFATKLEEQVPVTSVMQALELVDATADGRFWWMDFAGDAVDHGMQLLEELGCERPQLESLVSDRPTPYFSDLEDFVLFTLLDADWSTTGVSTHPLAVCIGTKCLVTMHRAPSPVIDAMRQSYSRSFRRIALSPGFLLYALASHLCESYTQIVGRISDDNQAVQDNLFRQADEGMFERVAELLRAVSEFQKVVVYAREIVHDLSLRRSPMIPITTQPYLEKKAGLLDRLSADVTSERELLSETVSLYLGIVTHRTNHTLSRLTVLGTLILPLTFLTGVYGMNFEFMPELKWEYGYYGFWGVVLVFGLGVIVMMKRKHWI